LSAQLTYRANPQRTGSSDQKEGPANPKVLWAYKSQDHFIASPLPADDRVYITGVGAFNVSTLYAFSADPKASERIVWKKSIPYLKLPSVSTPALFKGLLIFGDGMHQTSGAILHCLRAEKGLPVWQYPVPGDLVHLEGSPTIAGDRAIIGGGSAGVLCVDINRVTLEGKERSLADIQKLLEEKWAQLQAKYEQEKKKDPAFAVPPSEADLPKPAPLLGWQQGQDKWHVDAPIAVIDNQVLVGSAFLDKEQLGDRALYSLDLRTGAIQWRTPLKLNPWGGPSVQGDTVIVTGSTVGYDLKVKNAKGDIAAYDLKTGKEKWRKEVSGGVVSCAALTKELAVVTATDGKVRAFEMTTGERRWIYDARMPLFAPVALTGTVAYAGDLRGVIHAIDLTTGAGKWTLDLGADPAVKAAGAVYGGPVVQGGRVYVATCNLEGDLARQPTVVVCIGEQ
jgi:outer membrane protein assembly factor BamB